MGRMRSIVTVPGASKACLSKSRKSPHNSKYKAPKNSVTGRKSAGLRLLVSGHSFIRHWKWVTLNTITPPVSQGDRCDRNVQNQPIQVYRDATHDQSEMLANRLEVTTVYRRVFTVAKGISLIADLLDTLRPTNFIPIWISKNPDAVVVAIGSNDLAKLHNNFTQSQVRTLAHDLKAFAAAFNPSIPVTFMGVVPRDYRSLDPGMIDQVNFRSAARVFNEELQRLEDEALGVRDNPTLDPTPTNFRYGRMRGWDYCQVMGQQVELPVSSWANSGGVHPRNSVYLDKWNKSLKNIAHHPKSKPSEHPRRPPRRQVVA